MARILTKTDISWGENPETFDCRLTRSEEGDPADPSTPSKIVWRLVTRYEVLTAEGETISQEEVWVLPPAAVTVVEGLRSRVINRLKRRNDI